MKITFLTAYQELRYRSEFVFFIVLLVHVEFYIYSTYIHFKTIKQHLMNISLYLF